MLQVGGCQEVPLQKGCGVGTSRLGVRYGLKRLVGCLSAGSLEQRRSFSGGGRSPIGWRQIRFGEPPVQRTQKASFLLRGHGALYNRPYVRAVLPNSTPLQPTLSGKPLEAVVVLYTTKLLGRLAWKGGRLAAAAGWLTIGAIVKNPPNTRLEKFVKLSDHNCDCNDLTDFDL